MSPEDEYCFNLVRQVDRDRYLASLFAPEDKRADLLALYAFNAEISNFDAFGQLKVSNVNFDFVGQVCRNASANSDSSVDVKIFEVICYASYKTSAQSAIHHTVVV